MNTTTMGERIKYVRTSKNMTQQDFADAIGCGRSTIANYELNAKAPVGTAITAICDKFHVDRVWLETGAGEPFRPVSRDEYIAEVLTRAITNNDSARDRLIRAFCQLPDEMYDEAEKILIEVISNLQKEKE